jgi:hypothetical protein
MNIIGVIFIFPLRRSVYIIILAFSNIIHERFYLPEEKKISEKINLILDPNLQKINTAVWNLESITINLKNE